MTIQNYHFDERSNKTHVQVATKEFTEWYWVSGRIPQTAIFAVLTPVINARLVEFAIGEADTPHEIESPMCGLL